MLLNKTKKCNCSNGVCNCKSTNENVANGKELLGSFNQKLPVLETKNHEYKVVKNSPKENILLS